MPTPYERRGANSTAPAASQGPRIILVASALPGEGADTIASNIAHHYAMTGSRVLLADGDADGNRLTRQLAPQRLTGFADQLRQCRPVEAAVLRDGLTGCTSCPQPAKAPLGGSIPELLASAITAEAVCAPRAALRRHRTFRAASPAGQRRPHSGRLCRPDRLRHDLAENAQSPGEKGAGLPWRQPDEDGRRRPERSRRRGRQYRRWTCSRLERDAPASHPTHSAPLD